MVRATTILTESSLSSGRTQPSENLLSSHYSNEKTNNKSGKKRKAGSASTTVLEYNLFYVPRIHKNDLRRQYPVMFSNVFNTCDAFHVNNYLQTFCRPDLKLVIESFCKLYIPFLLISVTLLIDPHLHERKDIVGYEHCGIEFMDRMTDAPDSIFTLNKVQMRVRSDGTCSVHSQFELKGTKMIYIEPKKIMGVIMFLLSNSRVGTLPDSESSQSVTKESPVKAIPVNQPSSIIDDPPDDYLFSETAMEAFDTSESDDLPVSADSSSPPTQTTTHNRPIITALITSMQDIPLNSNNQFYSVRFTRSNDIAHDAEEEKQKGKKVLVLPPPETQPLPSHPQGKLQATAKGFDSSASSPPHESDYEYLYSKFESAMNLNHNPNEQPKPEETLQIAIPYHFIGQFTQHIDLESKVYGAHFAVKILP